MLKTYNTKRAHEDIIFKSGCGLWNTLQHAIYDVYNELMN